MPVAFNNIGAVTILSYNPSTQKFDTSQIIRGDDVLPKHTHSKFFGLTISKTSANIDNNNQDDIVVGAKNKVVVLFSQQVISMGQGFPRANFKNKELDLDASNSNCNVGNNDDVICFETDFCIDQPRPGVRMNVTLDSGFTGGGRRVFVMGSDPPETQIVLNFDRVKCQKVNSYIILSMITDYSTDIKFQMDTYIASRRTKRETEQLQPVLDPASAQKSVILPLAKHCGKDNICTADFRVNSVFKIFDKSGNKIEHLTIAEKSSDLVQAVVKIRNNGENAWNTFLLVRSSRSLSIDNEYKETDVVCSPLSSDLPENLDEEVEWIHSCAMAMSSKGAFKANTKEDVKLRFKVNEVNGNTKTMDVQFYSSGEKNTFCIAFNEF